MDIPVDSPAVPSAVTKFLEILVDEASVKNIEDYVEASLKVHFQAALDGSVDFDVYRSISGEISAILEGMDDTNLTAKIFLGAFKERAHSAADALVDIQRESLVEVLKTDQTRVTKRYDTDLLALKKDYESKKKALHAEFKRDMTKLDDDFRADHPVSCGS